MVAMRADSSEDVALVRRFLHDRDEQAFRALYRAHTPALLGVAWRLADGDQTEAEDLVQEAWICAAERLATFRRESTLRTWLVGIVVNCGRNRARRRARSRDRETELAAVIELPAPPPFAPDVEKADVEAAIARLPEGAREVLLLHDVFGYTHEEVARMLGVEPGTSKSQLSRARSTLRRWLSEKGGVARERRVE